MSFDLELLSKDEFNTLISDLTGAWPPGQLTNIDKVLKVLSHTCAAYAILRETEYRTIIELLHPEYKKYIEWISNKNLESWEFSFYNVGSSVTCKRNKKGILVPYMAQSTYLQKEKGGLLTYSEVFEIGKTLTDYLDEYTKTI